MKQLVSDSPETLIAAATADFESLMTELLAQKDQVRVLLTGGTLGIDFIKAMAKLDLDYSRIWLMFSDERYVPLADQDRNESQAIRVWPELSDYLTRYPDANQTLLSAREELEAQLFGIFEAGQGFDLAILGMGPDGHVASLFPGHQQHGKWIIAEANSPKPPAQRLSFSYEGLAQSKRVWFLAAGQAKAEAVSLAINSDQVPASRVRGTLDTRWYLDKSLSDAL